MYTFTIVFYCQIFTPTKCLILYPQICFSSKFHFCSVLNSKHKKRCFWKVGMKCNQHPSVNVHPLALEVTRIPDFSLYLLCQCFFFIPPSLCIIFHSLKGFFMVKTIALKTMRQSYVAMELFAIMVIHYYVLR